MRHLRVILRFGGSGTVIHNYNTAFFDHCGFFNNTAYFQAFNKMHMDASILYAEPYSMNIFRNLYGQNISSDSFYCDSYSTTIIYSYDATQFSKLFRHSWIMQDAYFALVNSTVSAPYNDDTKWVVSVSNKFELINVLYTLNTYINATEVVIDLAPGDYVFTPDDYELVRGYEWRGRAYEPDSTTIVPIKDRYLLDVGFAQVTINGHNATIRISGNAVNKDYHLAFVGTYGSLTLNDLNIGNFNTALYVTGSLYANNTTFTGNAIHYSVVGGDVGGAIRSFCGSVVCHYCNFLGNAAGGNLNDIYAELSSYVEIKHCLQPYVQMKDSYLKCSLYDKENIEYTNCFYEDAFEDDFSTSDFEVFNVSDDVSYNAVLTYLNNHTVSCLMINFTNIYTFNFTGAFDRSMSVVFQNNGFDVGFNRLNIGRSSTMTFINFDFGGKSVINKGSVTFINCSFHNYNGGSFLVNEGSCSMVNCSVFSVGGGKQLINNTGSLTIYDSVFANNNPGEYGVVYNYGGSVTCMNVTFGDGGYAVYNFNSGDCSIAGFGAQSASVKFDKPWSNFKTGLVKGAFMLGTAVLTFGTGAVIGAFVPTVAGMIVASVAGAGIGFASGLGYGFLEGSVYHDYSNLWGNALSFTMLGFSMGNLGWTQGSDLVKRIFEELHGDAQAPGQAGPGGAGSQGGQGSQAPGGQASSQIPGKGNDPFSEIYKDPIFKEALDNCLKDGMNSMETLRNAYPDLVNYWYKSVDALFSNPQASAQDVVNLFDTLNLITSTTAVNGNRPVNNPVNIANRMHANTENNNIIEDHPENLLNVEANNAIISNYLGPLNYLDSRVRGNNNLSYLQNRLTLDAYNFAEGNRLHADRVLRLLNDFSVLDRRARNLGIMYMSNSMVSYLSLYRENIGARGLSRTISSLFDSSHPNRIVVWENIYNSAQAELNRILVNAGLDDSYVNNPELNTAQIITDRIDSFIHELDARFSESSVFYDKYVTLKQKYTQNFVDKKQDNIDLLLSICHELEALNNTINIDVDEYNKALSFNLIELFKSNPYNGIFNRPAYVGSMYVWDLKDVILRDMNALKSFNPLLYEFVISSEFDEISKNGWQMQKKYKIIMKKSCTFRKV